MERELEKTHRRIDGRPLGRRLGWLILLAGLALAAYLLLGSRSGLPRQAELRRQLKALEERRAAAVESLEHYAELLQRLDEDDAFLEKLVRERLGLAAPQERVYVIIDRTAASGDSDEKPDSVWTGGGEDEKDKKDEKDEVD